MNLQEFFSKDIERSIEPVIKADDALNLESEIREYVLTKELLSSLEMVLDTYVNFDKSRNANGVWVAGFFGSGKSHLLKMLAHLLGNVPGQDFPREEVIAAFKEKVDDSNFTLEPLIQQAGKIPAKSLLFNIDAKADVSSKEQEDALLRVFVKVFNEARGYYGTKPPVARFERDLDRNGQLQAFKEAFERKAKISWEQGRKQDILQEANITSAYAEITGEEAAPQQILKKYKDTYSISIEDFANEVKEWLDSQEDQNMRLNFMVDEVGQFIGRKSNYMLNLQTIAEQLAIKCQGRAWIFVTAQEAIDKVVGDISKTQGNDFSKIRDRFATHLNLTSKNVEEVIEKRLLEKNTEAKSRLRDIYDLHKDSFSTWFNFRDDSRSFPVYRDSDAFINLYPFVPYQFPLFQDALVGLSEHNLLQGRHSSVGERSMLAVVQMVLKDLKDRDDNQLVPFDALFTGLRSAVKSLELRSISRLEEADSSQLQIRILKCLFLVKYLEDFKATPANLRVLLMDGFDINRAELESEIRDALNALERQNLVQRKGEQYAFLTNEEQDMEREIKNEEVEESQLNRQLRDLIFGVIDSKKIRYLATDQDFECGFSLDLNQYSMPKDLNFQVYSPRSQYSETEILAMSANSDDLCLVMPTDDNLSQDLELIIKTESYAKKKHGSSALNDNQQFILRTKMNQKEDDKRQLRQRVSKALAKSALIFKGREITTKAEDPQQRVNEAFQEIIPEIFYRLDDTKNLKFDESSPRRFAAPTNDTLEGSAPAEMNNLALELEADIKEAAKQRSISTVQNLVDKFGAKPYGWKQLTVTSLVGYLIGEGKVRLTLDGKSLSPREAGADLEDKRILPNLRIDLQKDYDPGQRDSFRRLVQRFVWGQEQDIPQEPAELVKAWKSQANQALEKIQSIRDRAAWPFNEALADAAAKISSEVTGREEEYYFENFPAKAELERLEEDLLTPVFSFVKGKGAQYFTEAQAFLDRNRDNLHYLAAADNQIADTIRESLADPEIFRGNKPFHLKEATDKLRAALAEVLNQEREKAQAEIRKQAEKNRNTSAYREASEESKEHTEVKIADALRRAEQADSVAAARQSAADFKHGTKEMLADLAPAAVDNEDAAQKVEYVRLGDLELPVAPAEISSESDLDVYLQALRTAILSEIKAGKTIIQ